MERSPHLTWIEIDLDAIQHNTRVVKSVSGVDVMAVVKAEAYGFGGVQVEGCGQSRRCLAGSGARS